MTSSHSETVACPGKSSVGASFSMSSLPPSRASRSAAFSTFLATSGSRFHAGRFLLLQISPLVDVNLQIAQPRDRHHQVAVVKVLMVQRDGVELLKLKQREPHISELPPNGWVA